MPKEMKDIDFNALGIGQDLCHRLCYLPVVRGADVNLSQVK